MTALRDDDRFISIEQCRNIAAAGGIALSLNTEATFIEEIDRLSVLYQQDQIHRDASITDRELRSKLGQAQELSIKLIELLDSTAIRASTSRLFGEVTERDFEQILLESEPLQAKHLISRASKALAEFKANIEDRNCLAEQTDSAWQDENEEENQGVFLDDLPPFGLAALRRIGPWAEVCLANLEANRLRGIHDDFSLPSALKPGHEELRFGLVELWCRCSGMSPQTPPVELINFVREAWIAITKYRPGDSALRKGVSCDLPTALRRIERGELSQSRLRRW